MHLSARAVYYAPSDLCGIKGLHSERLRATPSWHHGAGRYDTVFIGKSDADRPGFAGLFVARVRLFFSFKHNGIKYPCALIHWFSTVGETPDEDTGLWMVEPDFIGYGVNRRPFMEVVHLDVLLRGAHLIGLSGTQRLPDRDFVFSDALDRFQSFYVNKYADHHSHEIAF